MIAMSGDYKEEILSRLTPQDVYGSNLQRGSGKWSFKMCCPLHSEKTPSFLIRDDMHFHCFGCNAGGDVFEFIKKRDNVEFPEAFKTLAKLAGVELSEKSGFFSQLYGVNKAAAEFYQSCLKKNANVMAYLTEDRKFTRETIEAFGLGSTNGASVVAALRAKGFKDSEILDAGIGRQKDGEIRDYFWNHVIFPIMQRGKIRGFGGRALSPAAEMKYINTQTTLIFKKSKVLYGLNAAAIKEARCALVLEGYADVIMAHQCGHKNTTACLGTAFGEHHIELLKKYTDTVYLVFDGDEAGLRAAKAASKLCFKKRLKGGVVILPGGEDPDSFLRNGGSWHEMISKARAFSIFLSQEFPELREKIRDILLTRNPREVEEFFSLGCTAEEMKVYYGLRSRDILAELFNGGKLVGRLKGVEVKEYGSLLGLFRNKKFVYAEKSLGDYKQPNDMIKRFLELLTVCESKEGNGAKG